MPPAELNITIRYTLQEIPGKGWIARADDLHATAQGATEEEAFENLQTLMETYPDILQPLIDRAREHPKVDLVPA